MWVQIMAQSGGLFRADFDTIPARNALEMGIRKKPILAAIIELKCFRWAVFHAGPTPHASLLAQIRTAKQQHDHEQHDLTAENMQVPQVAVKKRDVAQLAMGKKITAQKRQCRYDNENNV